MKYFAVFFVLGFIFYACSGGNNSQQVAEGQKIFTNYCAACHGEDGKLGLNDSKDLTKSEMTLDQQIEIVSNGKGLMTPFKELLSGEQIKAVSLYVMSLKE